MPACPFHGGKQEGFIEFGIRRGVHIRPERLDVHFAVMEARESAPLKCASKHLGRESCSATGKIRTEQAESQNISVESPHTFFSLYRTVGETERAPSILNAFLGS